MQILLKKNVLYCFFLKSYFFDANEIFDSSVLLKQKV